MLHSSREGMTDDARCRPRVYALKQIHGRIYLETFLDFFSLLHISLEVPNPQAF